MNSNPKLSPRQPISRRWFLNECGVGIGKIALAGLMTHQWTQGQSAAIERDSQLFTPRSTHYTATAKNVIHLFMAGAPSQLDLFDHKPELKKLEGQPLPPSVIGGQRYAFIRPDAAVLGPVFNFRKHGQSGAEISDAMPFLAEIVDDICLVKSVYTDQFNHAPAQIFFNTGFAQPGRPCMGSWVTYGLGSQTRDLPAFVVMSTGAGISGGTANWSSGFLPTAYTGVRFRNQGDPILHVSRPEGYDARLQSDSIDLIKRLNHEQHAAVFDPEILTRVESYEMAYRLQTSAPELLDLQQESKSVLDLYGCDPAKPDFARACLLARRMIERGVRFINIYHEGWDAHSDVEGNVKNNAGATDRAAAALVKDLKQRGMLDETLVVWGGEFGRTPMVETNPALGRKLGRDHHPQAFTMWMAGGGIKPGLVYGSTDELGFHIAENPVHVHDIQATILHCLGLDHERLTFTHQGRQFRLTDVHGKIIQDILKA